MDNHHFDTNTSISMIGGTVLGFIGSLHVGDVANTATLAAVGSVVSFLISWGMRSFKAYVTKKREE